MGDLAGRLVVGLADGWPTDAEATWLARYQPAGVILFSRNVIDYNTLIHLCVALHELVPGLEIMTDHEGGPVSQLAAALGRPPGAWSLGVLDDAGLTARVFAETGRRLKAVGIDRVLAPVADVLTAWRNPVIGARSFGSDPTLVARHTVAATTGLLAAEMKVCLKHWPGHGGSQGDSHLVETEAATGAVPAPFESGLHAGAGAVMVGHLLGDRDPAAGGLLPATLDPVFLTASRKRLGAGRIDNLLFLADDVSMGALGPAMRRLGVAVPPVQESGLYDPTGLPLAWFEKLAAAGCDRFLIRGIPLAAFPLSGALRKGLTGRKSLSEKPREPLTSTGPYAEARERLWETVAADFADPGAELMWLDYSRGDRWAVAAGQGVGSGDSGGPHEFLSRLRRMFLSVHQAPAPRVGKKPWTRILVSSHRPLPDLAGIEALGAKTASRGVCLAMGHPSLKTDLESRLGPGWRVGGLFDIAAEDLPKEGTKI